MTHGLYNPILIAASVIIAIFAGYTALDLANSVVAARGRARAAWLTGGSLAMGTGIWSMHFVGMLAFRLPGVSVYYTIPLLVLSVVVAIVASGIALLVVSRSRPALPVVIAAGLTMGGAICGMHYIGIASMRLAARIEWEPRLVAASIAIAVVASYVALWLAFRFRRESSGGRAILHRLAGGVLMGLAISGMHYTAMAAMSFLPGGVQVPIEGDNVLATEELALAVTLTTLMILGIALAGAIVDRALTRRTVVAEQAEQRAEAEAALHEFARTLAAAENIQDVVHFVVHNALEKTQASGACIEQEQPAKERREVEIMAAAGKHVPAAGIRVPYASSLTKEIAARGQLQWPTRLENLRDPAVALHLKSHCQNCTGLIVPLFTETSVLGVLVLVRAPDQPPYQSSELAFAAALGDMTSAALRRVLLLQQLTASEQRFRELAANIREIFWIIDPHTRNLLYVSPALEDVLGRPLESLTAETSALREMIHPEDLGRVDLALDALTRHEHEVECRVVRPDGSVRWVHARGSPIRNGQGEVSRIVGIAEDVTTRRASEEKQRFLAEASRILATSLDYSETLGNVARIAVPQLADWCAILLRKNGGAVRPHEVGHVDAGKTRLAWKLHEGFPTHTDSAVRAYNVLRTGMPELISPVDDSWLEKLAESPGNLDLLRSLAPRSIMLVPLIARGRTLGMIWLALSDSGRSYDADDLAVADELTRRAAAAIDNAVLHRESMDARREAEQRAQQEIALREDLERVTESRARLMRGFSHDVREPLHAADGYLSLMEEGVVNELNEKQLGMVRNIRRSIHRAVSLTSDLLELARAEAGQLEVQFKPVQLTSVTLEVVEDYRATAEAAGLHVETNLPAEFPTIESDTGRVRQILSNLISNAIRYTPEGTVTVQLEAREGNGAPGSGQWAAVDVSDTGPGLSPEQVRDLFEEFRRFAPSVEGGSGIGLAISRTLARLLGGDITVVSREGQGSTFTLWLPLETAEKT